MAKVGIMSMQRIANYGSFLQAYGLRAMLEELGHEVCFVDYHVGQTLLAEEGKDETGWKRKIHKVTETMNYDGPLTQKLQYVLHKKNFAKKYQTLLGLTPAPNYQPKLDILLIGSDEVFNCIQANPNVGYSPELFGEGHRARRLISYAASFGNTTLEKLERFGKAEEVGRALQKFDAVSVRDVNSARIVEKLSGKVPEYHLDPVLIYDFMGRCEQIPEVNYKEKYLLLYAYSGRILKEEAEWIRQYARGKGWKIYAIGGVQSCADKFINCSPFEVLAYFKAAEEVVTDTFHGTVFSVITGKRFVTLVRKSVGDSYGNEEKLRDLLERLNLKERQAVEIYTAGEVLGTEIQYIKTEEIVREERLKSITFFKEKIK